jgi:glycosyltransferase involved in cell wall biosynthesis
VGIYRTAETVIITMGSGKSLPESVDIPAFNFGFVNEDAFKAVLYCAADLFVFPTRNEAFGIVSTESMACGTPIVAFNVGGVPDAVRPGITGLLADRENVEQLRDNIVQLLEDEPLRLSMSTKCRAIAVEEYSLKLYTQRYINLYHQVIGERAQSSDASKFKSD